MQAIATWAMRGRPQAVITSSLFALVSLLLPPLMYLSAAVVALVALRKGPNEGLLVMAGAAGVVALAGLAALGNAIPAVALAATLWLPVWALALLLRKSASQGVLVSVVALVGLGTVVLLYLALGSPADWWQEQLLAIKPTLAERGMELDDEALAQVSRVMTGGIVALGLLGVMSSVWIGRWWQSLLYNPGGFGQEFREMRVDRRVAYGALAVLLLSLLGGGPGQLAMELVPLVLTVYMVQALAIAHWIVKARGLSVGWLVGLYLMLVLFWPWIMVVLGVFGLADSWTDLRRRSQGA